MASMTREAEDRDDVEEDNREDSDIDPREAAPWEVSAEWRSGEIPCSNQGSYLIWMIMGVLWSALSLWALPQFLEGFNWESDWPMAVAMAIVFPFASALMLVYSAILYARWKKFGRSVFRIKNESGIVGGKLIGSIHTEKNISPTGDLTAMLKCTEQREERSSKGARTRTYTRWKTESKIPFGSCQSVIGIPIDFSIPSDAIECGDTGKGTISWTLSLRSPTNGLNYFAEFNVPVFQRKRGRG